MKTYGSIQWDSFKQVWVIAEADPHVRIRLKSVFKNVGITRSLPFLFDDRDITAHDLLWFIQRYPLQISPGDLDRLKGMSHQFLNRQSSMEQLFRPDYQPIDLKLKLPLRMYQSQAVELWIKTKRFLLGDHLGLGKTVSAIGGMAAGLLPMLIILPKHLELQWIDQIKKFIDLRVHVIKGRKPYQLPEADVYLLRYSCVAGWMDTFDLMFYKSLVLEEAQELRREDSDKYRACKKASKNSEYVMGLSATPIYNYGDETFPIWNAIFPGSLGSKEEFLREWTDGGREVRSPEALGSYLRENFLFLRRTREEVGMELPPVNKIVHYVDVDQEEVRKSEEIAKTIALRVVSGSFIERGMASRDLDIFVRQYTGIAKAKSVASYVKMLLEAGEPVILAGWHRAVYDIWLEELKDHNPAFHTGTESEIKKYHSKNAFVSGETNLLIFSLRSGAGLDGLQQRGSIIVFGELDWSPQVHNQLIGRLDRDGQQSHVTAIYLVTHSGSDPLMIDLLGLKASQQHGIVDPFSSPTVQHSDEGRIKLLAEMFLKKKGDGNE